MNKLKALIQIEIQSILNTTNFVGSRFKKQQKLGLLMLLFPAIIIVYIFVTYASVIFSTFPYELGYLGLLVLLLLAFLVVTYLAFYSAYGHLFGLKDFDFLMSLPINGRQMFLSKIISFVLMSYFYTFCALVPIFTIYLSVYSFDGMVMVQALIISLSFPFIPIVIASIFSLLISLVGNRSRHKGVLKLVISILSVVGLMIGMGYLNTFLLGESFDLMVINERFRQFTPNIYYSVMAIKNQNLSLQFGITMILLVLFAIFVFLFSKLFIQINRTLSIGYKKQNYTYQKQKRSSVMLALFKRECSRYLTNVSYVINTGLGSFTSLFGTIYLLFNQSVIEVAMLQFEVVDMVPVICAVVFVMTGLLGTTACSISLEGKKLWILKSSPIAIKDIFLAKILLSIIVSLPVPLISIFIVQLIFKLSLLYFPLFVVIGTIMALFTSQLGLMMNLCFPKLDWEREIYVVKNSMSVFLTTMVSGGLILVVIFMGSRMMDTAWIMEYIYGVVAIFAVFNAMLYLWLKHVGVKKFRKLA